MSTTKILKLFLFLSIISLLNETTIAADKIKPEDPGRIEGFVFDRETSEPVAYAYVFLEEINRTTTAHSDGSFSFRDVPEGEYTLTVQRMGYRTLTQKVELNEDDTATVEVSLQPTVLQSESIEVVAEDGTTGRSSIEHASQSLSGTRLRQNLGNTLSKSLEELAGFESRTMGSATARPVMRGLGGERVLILQDGERTGDVSSQSADHAVTVDPSSAEEIEVARGPAALIYGSNAIGGVVNVVRNQISGSVPDHLHGSATLQGESVNSGGVGAVEANLPLGDFALQADGNFRTAGDISTPAGTLDNSGLTSSNNAMGLSYVQPWGYAGAASSIYLNSYGIPPDPNGHADGVDINMQKYQFEGASEIYIDDGIFESISVDISHKSYYHEEIEPGGSLGTEFGVLTSNASLKAKHGEMGFLDEGTVGLWGEIKDYAVNNAGTPDSDSYSLAAFAVEEKDIGRLHLEAGLRYDFVTTVPNRENPDSRIGHIRQRTFDALASSGSAIFDLGKGFNLGTTLIHSFRAPSQEELYSEGPHLASYSYEIGNPDLDAERGLGKELFVRHKSEKVNAEVAAYHNAFSNYIYPRNTGEANWRFPTLNNYQFEGATARTYGVEASSEIEVKSRFVFSGTLGYTIGERALTDRERELDPDAGNNQPLPMIPPLKGKLMLMYAEDGFQIGGRTTIAASQSRTGDFEEPTDGYTTFGVFGQYRFQAGGLLHTLTLNGENIFNREHQNHLSRIKELVPEPGRNISVLYRVYF